MNRASLIILVLFPILSNAQNERFTVNNFEFEIESDVVANEWESMDTIQKLYRVEDSDRHYVLEYYPYKDEGGDCNNLFWYKEAMEVDGDSIVFTIHYFQKTGIDPIPEWRKQIYVVNDDGLLILTYDKYKYYNSSEWEEE